MNLPFKLAYSQLKINRSRTVFTLMGIIISTVLITAICNFGINSLTVVSIFLTVADGYDILLLIPIAILVGIVMVTSVIVISNAFRISAGERISQFGVLKSVGATKRQITATVLYESILLSAAGIPIGITVGLILAFFSVEVANHFLNELNSLMDLMLKQFEAVIVFLISWQALTSAALISFLTVLLSAWLPARKAAKITAIASIRGVGEIKVKEKQLRTSRFTQMFFGFEGMLAAKNIKRNKRSFRAGIISLTVSVVMFITISSLTETAGAIEKVMYPDYGAPVTVDYTSQRDDDNVFAAPLNSEDMKAATEKLREYDGASIYALGSNFNSYNAVVPEGMFTPEMLEAYFGSEPLPEYEVKADVHVVDEENYAALCELAGVPSGSNLLINRYDYNDNGNVSILAPVLFDKQNIRLINTDGSIQEVPVHGEINAADVPEYFIYPNTGVIRLIVSEWDYLRGCNWYAGASDVEGFMAYARTAMEEIFPGGQNSSAYMAPGFNIRIYRSEDYVKIMNVSVMLVIVFVYCFAVLLALIGLTSVISTTSANVMMRAREFAVLQSVGMTSGGIKRMLNLESVISSAKSLVIGLPLGIILTYLINIPVRSMFPVPYKFPLFSLILCIVFVFAITWVTMRFSASRLRGRSIIETIRAEIGR